MRLCVCGLESCLSDPADGLFSLSRRDFTLCSGWCGFMRPFLSAGINFLGELGLPVLCVVSVLFLQKIFEPSL